MNEVFKALNDPTRRKILELLRQKDMTAGEIAGRFEISKPSISHHLDLLKQADLVLAEKRGQFVLHSLNTSVLDECLSWLMDLSKPKEKRHEAVEKRMDASPGSARSLLRRRPVVG
ncbi:MAG TPA: autorepressor SdpR family transcription factor [Verrucomicrobiae bacterium]|nr:autorepressor SdpR family transcription factor [Verrucomicrobiae bacterium]